MSDPQVVVEISLNGKSIDLFSPYFPGVADMCKLVPGARWNAEHKHWRYPLDMQTCRMLRKTFTDMLIIGPELTDWARRAVRNERKMHEMTKATDAALRHVPGLLPRIDAAMANRTYQRVGAAYMAASPSGGVLLADQPGLGKTIQTLAGIAERGVEKGIHLVAPPATAVRIVWEKEVKKWTDWGVWAATGSAAQRHKTIAEFYDAPLETKFLVVNPEMVRTKLGRWCSKCKAFEEDMQADIVDAKKALVGLEKEMQNLLDGLSKAKAANEHDAVADTEAIIKDCKADIQSTSDQLDAANKKVTGHRIDSHNTAPRVWQQPFPELFEPEWSSITVDESHRFLSGIKSPVQKTQVGEGFCRLKLAPGGLKVALSGTPAKGKPINFWGALHWLNPALYRSKWQWAEQYLQITDNGFGKSVGGVRPEKEEAFYKSLDTVMLRRTKSEVVKELPPKDVQEHWIDPTPKQLKQYQEMLTEGETMFGDTRITAVGVLSEMTRLKQIATAYQGSNGPIMKESCKWEYLMEMLQERGVVGPVDERFGDSKFVIASQFTQVIDAMEIAFREMGVDVLKITGSVSPKKRLEAQNAFQAKGGVRIILINTMAGGVAIDLDQHCDELFFMDETFVPDDQEQVEDRIHRVSRIHQVTIHYFYSRGSIDEAIALSNVSKDEVQKKILDGRRGVEFALRLLREIQ